MRFTILIVAFLVTLSGSAQNLVNEEYFSEDIPGYLTKVYQSIEVDDGIIIAGTVDTLGSIKVVVIRLNMIGEVIWSTLSQPEQIDCYQYIRIKLFDDGYIYGQGCLNIWKINATNGQYEWINTYNYYTSDQFVEMEDYDSSRYLIVYKLTQFNVHVAFIDKVTGNKLDYTLMEPGHDMFQNIAVDPYGNILYASKNTIHKFNGNNLNLRIWKESYNTDQNDPNKIEIITELYCDAYGDIFIWGYHNNNSSNLILAKVSTIDGAIIWKTQVDGNLSLKDFVDKFDYLYMSLQHKLVGGGSGSFHTSKVNKNTGSVEWFVHPDMTPLESGVCGSYESANVLEVNCQGDVFLNGYYGDGNYGPAIWGLMKLHSDNGLKEYDRTIIHDSLHCDNISEGVGVAVIKNIPIFVGNEEVIPWETKATFIAIDTLTGLPNIRHHIGNDYQYFSTTIDIQNSNDSMFLLIQNGKQANIRMSTTFGVSDWEFTDFSSDKTKAGCISVNSNSAYFVINKLETDNLPIDENSNTSAILFFQLDKNTGSVIQQDSLVISGNIKLIEMESDSSGTAYLLYSDDLNINLIRWDVNGLSLPVILSSITANLQSNRPLNLLDNYSNNELLFSGNQNLYSINKSTLFSTPIFTFPTSRNIYDINHVNGKLILSGNDNFGFQTMLSIDTSTFSLNWDQTYQPGIFAGTIYDQDTIYTFGEKNGNIQVVAIVASTGIPQWEYLRSNISGNSAVAYALSFSPSNERFVVNGAEKNSNGSSNIAMDRIDRFGNGSSMLYIPDELNYQSYAYCSSSQYDSLLWVGGSLNRTSYGKQGVNYLIQFFQCPIISIEDTVTACNNYTWIDGNTYTTTNNSATWTLPSINGCDSLIRLNLTIVDIDTTIIISGSTLTASDTGLSYQWIDCENNNTPISGETNQSYTATTNGNYAVIITDGECSATSECHSITNLGVIETELGNSISIYPNPTNQELNIDLGQEYSNIEIEIKTLLGQVVFNQNYSSIKNLKLNLIGTEGIYLMTIQSQEYQLTFRVRKQ